MKQKKVWFLVLSFALGMVLLFTDKPARAAESTAQGLTLSPPLSEVSVKPGEKSTQMIRVTNPTQNMVEVFPVAMNFSPKGEGGEPNFTSADDTSSKFSLANWITFSQPKLALMPNQVVEFKYDISAPMEAEPGGHYGVVFLTTNPPEKTPGASQVSISSMVGSLVLAKVPGEIKENGLLEEFSTQTFYSQPPVNFVARLRNDGNIHYKPEGTITINNWNGGEAGKIDFNVARGNVMPDSVRKFDEKWLSDDMPFYKIPVGRFTANLDLKYGLDGKALAGTVVFWIIPKWIVITIVALLLIIALIILIKFRKKRRGRRMPPPGYPPVQQNHPHHPPHPNQNNRPRM